MSSDRQRDHYEAIVEAYEAHYFDAWSLRYRERFIHDFLFAGLDLNGKRVADLACGTGQTSAMLKRRFPDADVEGFDISPTSCRRYSENTGGTAHVVDLTKPFTDSHAQFDAVIIIGGLHHCVSDLPQTLRNIALLLKPGGHLLMMEPNGRYLLEGVRKWWYRADRHFDAETEQALCHDEILSQADPRFAVDRVRHIGGPAYFLVLNSLILRVPLALKGVIAPPLLALERLWNAVQFPTIHAIFTARWTRTDA